VACGVKCKNMIKVIRLLTILNMDINLLEVRMPAIAKILNKK
jgi:hypothetical protein